MRDLLKLAMVVFAVTVAGCYQDSEVIVHEPGVYKGCSDPLLTQSAQDRASTLSDRFAQVQINR